VAQDRIHQRRPCQDLDARHPEPPDLERDVVDGLVAYAEQCATWLEHDMREAAALGHRPSAEQHDNLRRYRFTALFVQESYDR
jgi:hypothetical protein